MVNSGVFPTPTSRGGAENHVYYLSKSLSDLRVEIDLVSDIGDDAKFNDNIHVYPINMPELSLFNKGFKGYMLRHAVGGYYAFRKARDLLRSNYYDVIHVHGRVAPFFLSFFKNDTPVVFTINDDPPSKRQSNYYIYKISYKLFQETAAKRANHIIVPTDNLIGFLNQRGVPKNRISKIPNGVDINLFKSISDNNSNEANSNETPYAIFVGLITPRKGVKYLIKSISKIENVNCRIIGEGPEKNSMVRLSRDLKTQNRVEFLGSIEQESLPKFYNMSSFLVMPSLSETTCIAILEAFACEKPAIASAVGDIPNLIKDGYNGFLVEPKNVEQLQQKIKFLAENPELCREMGKNARKTVEEKYSWEAIAKQTVEIYTNVLRGKREKI
jgi:glycosyltransferase involved in cell wall biosynthesis